MKKEYDIKKIDKNFDNQENNLIDIKYYDPLKDKEIKVYGLNYFELDHRYHRLPKNKDSLVENLEGSVDVLARNTSGGLLAFYSDTNILKIKVNLSFMFHMGHMAYTGQAGFDLYMGKDFEHLTFYRASNFDFSKNEYEFTFFDFTNKKRGLKTLFILNFPLYASVTSLEVGINQLASIIPAVNLFPNQGRFVFYGTSITQGGCASRPGMSYTNILSRHLGIEILNFGFSGNGKGHQEIAEILADIKDVKAYVLNYEANVVFDRLKATLDPFVKTIRIKYPLVPIFIVSKIIMNAENHFIESKKTEKMIRNYQKDYVNNSNDNNLFYIDGSKLLGKTDISEKTVDGSHPTDYGFASIAKYLEPFLKSYIKA